MSDPQATTPETQIEDPKSLVQIEYDEATRALKEITLMLEQSRVEVGKLTQRNAAVTAHLQQIQNQINKIPGDELKSAYDSAMEAQQRLFVMRGQLEKLQSDQANLERYQNTLERLRKAMVSGGEAGGGHSDRGSISSVEMLINAAESERQRLSRQMHDGPAQALSNFILQTEIAMRLLDVDPAQVRSELSNLKVAAMNTFQKVRSYIFELRPMMLDDLGLSPTIKKYANQIKEQTGVDINVSITGNDQRMEPYLEVMIFRAMQELLSFAVQQNQATLVKIQLDRSDSLAKLSLDDNGKGFDTDALVKDANLGIKLIKDRTEMLGGGFESTSTSGKGSRITITIPIRS